MIKKVILVLFILTIYSNVYAEKRGQDLLTCMDKVLNAAKDQEFRWEMTVQEPNKKPTIIAMHVWVKDKKRVIHFVEPSDIKGMKVLVRSRSQMYVYLPAYRKIRRITSHAKRQSLFGADYNYDDQSTVSYADIFEGKFVSEDNTHYRVKAIANDKTDTPYGMIEFFMRKKDCLPEKVYYYNRSNKHIKTETRSEYSCQKGQCTARVMKMVDHSRGDHFTTMVRKEWNVNQDLSDSLFSKRALQRSN